MEEKEFYRKQIVDMVEKINRIDVLEYLCVFIKGKVDNQNNE